MKSARRLTPLLDKDLNDTDSYLAELAYRARSAQPDHRADSIYHWIN